MSKNIDSDARTSSFITLVNECDILIPAIQRDYAQGRKSAKTVRVNFTNAILQYIEDGDSHSLDFIYGSVENVYGRNVFIPLDGQQRLTTLFLLHIYLAGFMGHKWEHGLSFSYETRQSSKDFCQKIIENHGNVFNIDALRYYEDKKDSGKYIGRHIPSDVIRNEAWWFTKWDDDPTIAGMLVMLDRFDSMFFSNIDNNWEDAETIKKREHTALAKIEKTYSRLFNHDKAPIVFKFLPMKKFHDPDDLYIKMNARGLNLTSFEIFKSKLLDEVSNKLSKEEIRDYKADVEVRWIEKLWPVSRKSGHSNSDLLLERILKVVLSSNAAVLQPLDQFRNLEKIYEMNNKSIDFAFNNYTKQGVEFTPELLRRISVDCGIICKGNTCPVIGESDAPDFLPFFNYKDVCRRWILEGEKLTYRERLLLHAYLRFMQLNPQPSTPDFTDWMRLFYNLDSAYGIDNAGDISKALKDVETLFKSYLDYLKAEKEEKSVNTWLAGCRKIKLEYLWGYQWQEEITKAQLREKYDGWRALLEMAERQTYLNGQIGIALYVAGINIYDESTQDVVTPVIFKEYWKILEPLFNEIGDATSSVIRNYLMVQAMLSKGNYFMPASVGRFNICNRPSDRDYSWKALFRMEENPWPAVDIFKSLVDDISDPNDIPASLQKIINDEKENMKLRTFWEQALTSEIGIPMLKNSGQGFIAKDGKDILIYGQSRRSHTHYEFMTHYLYYYLMFHQEEFGICDLHYIPVRTREADCKVVVGDRYAVHWRGWTDNGNKEWIVYVKSTDDEIGRFDTINEVIKALTAKS